jgi:Ca-activated chloride channel family protein
VLGFGMGNLKDSKLETLADRGNGNYAYIDTLNEARKALVEQLSGTLVTIAKDVKIQIEFNPARVAAYRLIGYENRLLAARDFNDDTKDAGEIGAGHTVTALYELVLAGEPIPAEVDGLKYQPTQPVVRDETARPTPPSDFMNESFTLKLRYKPPQSDTSRLLEFPAIDGGASLAAGSTDFRFATAVAGFGMILRDSPHRGSWTLADVQDVAQGALGSDESGYRREFVELTQLARRARDAR